MTRTASILLAASAALALSGCVAAVVPMAAAGAIAKSKSTPRDRTPAPPPSARVAVFAPGTGQASVTGNAALATTRPTVPVTFVSHPVVTRPPAPVPTRAAAAIAPAPRPAAVAPTAAPTPKAEPTRVAITATPAPRPPKIAPTAASAPPSLAVTPPAAAAVTPPPGSGQLAPGLVQPLALPRSDYAGFARFAIAHAADAPGDTRLSTLVDPTTLSVRPERLGCGAKPPAVAIDLDPGDQTFDPADPPSPAPGLAEQLARLRSAGLVIFWKSGLTVDKADKIYTVLRAVGLDPDRTDRLLLARNRGDSKDARLVAAARDWCFVAVAGDRKGDFLEALDYLRDPSGPIATAVGPLYGAGWFLTPTPID